MHYYVHSLVSMRNLALACDMQSSMSLVRFQEQFKALSVASRDDRLAMEPPMTSQFLVDNTHIGFLMSDESNNVCLFNYMPETKESVGGEKLTLRAILNVGTNVNAWLRVKGHTSLCGLSSRDAKLASQQQSSLWASLDGSFGFVRPINEKSFRRLHFLQQFMATAVQQAAGLNPKGSRSAKPPRPTVNAANHKNMVDGDVVEQFMHLSTAEKQDLARRLGASRYYLIFSNFQFLNNIANYYYRYHIMDDLVQIRRLATYY
uniref:CPSF_A domain-containing protein n=1 Tax=Heterorhabditis bacteriophora TaxID=37862 RepID=A0A1I7WNC7_HETBA